MSGPIAHDAEHGGGGPLAGRRVLLTRRPEQSAALAAGLRRLGARLMEVPLIAVAEPEDIGPLEAALENLGAFDWLVFTSANAVHAVADRLSRATAASPPAPRLASVGPSTTEAVLARWPPGARLDLEPTRDYRAEGLLEAFRRVEVEGSRILLPTSDRARDVLAADLAARGARVTRVTAYRTVAPEGVAERLGGVLSAGVDLVVLASPSAVEGFVAAAGRKRAPAAVIGPVTENAARAAGFDVVAVATPSTVDGLLAAIAARFLTQSA